MNSFSIKIKDPTDKNEMDALHKAMEAYQDAVNKHIYELAKKLGVDNEQARDIWYLRGRSRWTPELEVRLLACYRAGKTLNIMEDTNEELIKLGF